MHKLVEMVFCTMFSLVNADVTANWKSKISNNPITMFKLSIVALFLHSEVSQLSDTFLSLCKTSAPREDTVLELSRVLVDNYVMTLNIC